MVQRVAQPPKIQPPKTQPQKAPPNEPAKERPNDGPVVSPGAPEPTSFKDLVHDVVPLKDGPRLVLPPPPSVDAVVVRARPKRELTVEDLGGTLMAWASDSAPRAAHDLGHIVPDHAYRRLDLHRMSASRALTALTTAIKQARTDGEPYMLVICGKGTHSGALGPVLSRLVVDELVGALAEHIVAFRTAPPRLGGEGALIVRLRKPSRPRR